MSSWFKRISKSISTETKEKKEVPDGLWHKCSSCKETYTTDLLVANLYVCPTCNFHNRINAQEYFNIIFDEGNYEELFANIVPKDHLEFVDVKPYKDRLAAAQKQTGLKDAMTVGIGSVNGKKLVIACMNFNFI